MNVNWTTATAIIGVALGVWNLVQSLLQRRVRLKVRPKLSSAIDGGFRSDSEDFIPGGCACIEVTNLSTFPVTIAEVGFSLPGEKNRDMIVPDPRNFLPKRLESREGVDVRSLYPGFPGKAKLAYATTQCKRTVYGDSPVLKKWRKKSST